MIPYGNNKTLIANAVRNAVMPSGIVKFNVIYVPRLNGYRITLVADRNSIDVSYISRIAENLKTLGYTTVLTSSRNVMGKYIVTLLALPGGASR